MSLCAGIYTKKNGNKIPQDLIDRFRKDISRNGFGILQHYESSNCFLLHCNIQSLAGTGWLQSSESVAMLCGDPLLSKRSTFKNRDSDLLTLNAASGEDLIRLLRSTRGNFSLVSYNSKTNEIFISTDKLGLRPIYWLEDESFVYFSSAKRLLEPLTNKSDIKGVVETLSFGFPLRDRTEFEDLKILEGGDHLKLSNKGPSLISYWDWSSDTPAPVKSSAEIKKKLHSEFIDSIEYRSVANSMHFAALSGGLDSRVVVAGLAELGRDVTTLNVSWPNTLDQILARQVASKLNTVHLEAELLPHEAGECFFPKSAQLIQNSGFQDNPDKTNHIWGGNDGSISVGYVYVFAEVIEKLRAGHIEQAAHLFIDLKGCNLSQRIFKKEFKATASSQAANSLIEEFKTISREDDGQKLFIYLLRANQRRMMHNDIENIDLLPYERIEPFFDTSFLSLTCALPIDESVGHGFYYDWLSEFPKSISTIPWQAYPTHKPCPWELPKNTVDQWYYAQQIMSNAKRNCLPNAFSELIARKSTLEKQVHFIDWNMLKIIKYANKLGLADGTTAMDQAIKACKHIQ